MKKLLSLLLASAMLFATIPITDYSYATTKQTQTKTKAQLDKEKKVKTEQEKKLKAEKTKCDEQLIFLRQSLDNLSLYEEITIESYIRGIIGQGTYDELLSVIDNLSYEFATARDKIKSSKKPMPIKVEESISNTMLELSDLMLKLETLIEMDKEN